MFKERWKDIYSYEGKYKISNYGRVYSVTNNKIMKPYPNKQGYLRINLNNKDGGHKYFIHKLVALHFIPNPGLRDSVNHIDGNPNNNKENNLEWTTPLENTAHAWKTGLATAKDKQRKVYQYDLNGKFIKEWESLTQASKVGGKKATHSNIVACCQGKRKSAWGYRWSYNKI